MRDLWEGRVGLARGERNNPEMRDEVQTVPLTWSSWISCGMASDI